MRFNNSWRVQVSGVDLKFAWSYEYGNVAEVIAKVLRLQLYMEQEQTDNTSTKKREKKALKKDWIFYKLFSKSVLNIGHVQKNLNCIRHKTVHQEIYPIMRQTYQL